MPHRGKIQYGQNYRKRSQYDQIIEVISEEEILEEHKIIDVKILEEHMEDVLEMVIFDRDRSRSRESIQVPLGGMIEVAVDQYQALGLVQIEVELDALGVGNKITLSKNVQICQRQKKIRQASIESSCHRCLWKVDEDKF